MTVIDKSGTLEWTDENIAGAPDTCGVYVLYDEKGIGYIGMTGPKRLRARLQEHKITADHPLTKRFAWYQTDTQDAAKTLEKKWITKYNPPWNKSKPSSLSGTDLRVRITKKSPRN